MSDAPHVPAAFINAIADEGTKAEAVEWLQRTWNELCAAETAIRKANERLKEVEDKLDAALSVRPEERAIEGNTSAEDVKLFLQASEHMHKFSIAGSLDRRLWDATERLARKALGFNAYPTKAEENEITRAVRHWYTAGPASEAMKHSDSRRYFCLIDQYGFALAQVCERTFTESTPQQESP